MSNLNPVPKKPLTKKIRVSMEISEYEAFENKAKELGYTKAELLRKYVDIFLQRVKHTLLHKK